MGKHIDKNQWLELINDFNNRIEKNEIYQKYLIFSHSEHKTTKSKRRSFFETLRYRAKMYNLGMEYILEYKRDPLMLKTRGRPKKEKVTHENIIDHLTIDELKEIARRYIEITKKMNSAEKREEIFSTNFQFIKHKSLFFNISRQAIYNQNTKEIKNELKKETICEKQKQNILAMRKKHKKAGRLKLSKLLLNKGIFINERTLGRFFTSNNLSVKSWRSKRKKEKEIKDVKNNVQNIIKRDYNDLNNRNIFATDVTYIPATKDAIHNHVYLSAIISHKTKKIISFSLSKSNDLEFITDHIRNTNFGVKSFILHTDNSFQYHHSSYLEILKNSNSQASYSASGNSLDNREIEYWFAVLKTEFLCDIDCSKLTLAELNLKINEFVEYYNNERIQSNLKWKTPQEYSEMFW